MVEGKNGKEMFLGDVKMFSVPVTQKLCRHAVDLVHRQLSAVARTISLSKIMLMGGNNDSFIQCLHHQPTQDSSGVISPWQHSTILCNPDIYVYMFVCVRVCMYFTCFVCGGFFGTDSRWSTPPTSAPTSPLVSEVCHYTRTYLFCPSRQRSAPA